MGKSGGPKISNFQKYRVTVRESSYKFFLLFTGLWAIDGTKLWSFGHLHMTPSAKNQPKMAFGPFWAIFEKPDFLTIFEVSYDPKQWRYTGFDAEFGFSAVVYPYTWILSPTLSDYIGFPEAQKVRFSGLKVVAQEKSKGKFMSDFSWMWMWELCLVMGYKMGLVIKNTHMFMSQNVAFLMLNKRVKQ